jgi:hypothetical protein
VLGLRGAVAAAHPEQHREAGADAGHALTVDRDRRRAHALHERPH